MLFIDANSRVEKEALRRYVHEELVKFKQEARVLISDPLRVKFWSGLHNKISTKTPEADKERMQEVEKQLTGLESYIQNWIDTAVDSPERFEFFILTKAEEIRGGNQENDYFWALQIRHDQLLALVKVLEKLLEHIRRFVEMSASKTIKDPVFKGLMEFGIEDQVYLEAEKIHRKRQKHIDKKR